MLSDKPQADRAGNANSTQTRASVGVRALDSEELRAEDGQHKQHSVTDRAAAGSERRTRKTDLKHSVVPAPLGDSVTVKQIRGLLQ